MLKRAFLRLSPEEQRAPPPPEDDETTVVHATSKADGLADAIAAADVAAAFDMAPCGVEPLPEESAASSLDAPPAAMPPVLASWRAAVAV